MNTAWLCDVRPGPIPGTLSAAIPRTQCHNSASHHSRADCHPAIEQKDIRKRARNAIAHQVFYALLLIALAILALIASCSFASNAISSSVNSMSFCGFFSTAILRHSSSIRWSGIVPLLASYFGSGSNDALTLIWPLETVIVRSHNLKPPFLMETRCWPGAAPIVEGVLPT